MKIKLTTGNIATATLLIAFGLVTTVLAQFPRERDSQDFFDQGHDRFDREIERLKKPPSETPLTIEEPSTPEVDSDNQIDPQTIEKVPQNSTSEPIQSTEQQKP